MPIQGNYFSGDHGFLPGDGDMPASVEPFTGIDIHDEDAIKNWMTQTLEQLSDYYGPYHRLQKDNIAMYVGDTLSNDTIWNGQTLARSAKGGQKTNLLRPIIETHVARLSSSRADVSVLPMHSSEYHDLAAARNAEEALRMSFNDRKVDQKFEDSARCMLVSGLAYMLVEWDNDIGPALPQLEEGIAAIGEDGEQVVDEDGKPVYIKPNIRLGDVNYRLLRPDQVYEQPSEWGHNTDWVIIVEMVDVYRLRDRYPTMADKIKCGDAGMIRGMHKRVEKMTPVYTIYHRSTPALPHGRMITMTPDVILENMDLPYPTLNKYGKLPVARLHDMNVPGYDMPLPLTVMESGKPYQTLHNRINNNILRNLSLQTPKWIVNSAAGVRLSHLNNMSNIVQYKGDIGMAPRLDSPRTTPAEVFNYRETLGSEMQVVTGASHILNVPPPNTRAASMLEHQEEQEFKRAEPLIKHYNNFQAEVAQIALAIMADRYDEYDERMVKLTAHGSSAKFLRLKTADLVGPYDVKFERTSALPQSKQGRLNEAFRLFSAGLIDEAQYKKVIGYNADPELASAETKAYEKQLLENDLMIRGHDVQPPLEHEDHVEHLRALYPLLQSIEFAEMPPDIKAKIVSHGMAHEMWAWKRAQVSQVYALKVLKYVQWILFTSLPEAMPVGMGNPGTPLENVVTDRLTTPGAIPSGGDVVPSPDNTEAV